MQTPIDFGKQFLNNYFDTRSEEKCLEDLAHDLVWITPKQMYHFLTDKEVRDYLHDEITVKEPERRFVDIVSIKSAPSVTDISTVAYELNLVPREEEKSIHLRCSMAIVKRGQHYEISFIHMSEKRGGGSTEQIREFSENLPCGVLIFAYMKETGLRTVFYNDYFARKLHYKDENFQRQMERDPFFMVGEEEREQLIAKLDESAGREPVTVNLTFYRRDGNRFQYRMIASPAYQEGENTVYYSIFQETTGFNRVHAQMRDQMATASDILGNVPGGLCVLTGETGDWKPVYVSRSLPAKFGLSMTGFAREIALDPFYGLEMTSITRKRITETHLEMLSQNPFVGTFQMVYADGTKRWNDVYLVNAADHNGNRLRMMYYVDKDEEHKASERQIAKAENASRLQQERARMEIREAQESARQQVEEAQTTVRREIEDAQAKTQEQIESFRVRMNQILDSQKGSVEEQERALRATYEAREKELVKAYEDKELELEEQYEARRKEQEREQAERQKTMDVLTAEYEKALAQGQQQIEKLEQENERVMHDLRESEKLRESQLTASKMRQRESELREQELARRDEDNQNKIRALTEQVAALKRQAEGGAVSGAAAGAGAGVGAGAVAAAGIGAASSSGAGAVRAAGAGAGASASAAGNTDRNRAESAGRRKSEPAGSSWLFDNLMHPAAAAQAQPYEENDAADGAHRDWRDQPPQESRPPQQSRQAQQDQQVQQSRQAQQDQREQLRQQERLARQAEEEQPDEDVLTQEPEEEEEQGDVLFNIENCMLDVLRLEEPACRRKHISLELRTSASTPTEAIGNKAGLSKALTYLMESAVEQSPDGGSISLGCRADMASGNRAYLYFTIRDNGSGIASELMTGMFDKKDEKSDPLRAGLYNAREIISDMGGNIRVRSRRGEGTEFTVTVCMHLPPRSLGQTR